jgi:hypothetical protein
VNLRTIQLLLGRADLKHTTVSAPFAASSAFGIEPLDQVSIPGGETVKFAVDLRAEPAAWPARETRCFYRKTGNKN